MGEIVVVRHGQTDRSRTGRHTGTTDLPLLPAGEDQAQALQALLAGRRFVQVRASPLQRARRTATSRWSRCRRGAPACCGHEHGRAVLSGRALR